MKKRKSMMSYGLFIFLALCIVVGFSGCSTGHPENQPQEPDQSFSGTVSHEAKLPIGFSWETLSKDDTRYRAVMTALGKHFCTGTYSDELDALLLNEDEKSLVKELFSYFEQNNRLPDEFKNAFTAFCVGDSFKNMIGEEAEEHLLYDSLSNSFTISVRYDWKNKETYGQETYFIDVKEPKEPEEDLSSKRVTSDNPLIFTFDDTEYTVGNCTFSVREIQMAADHVFKAGNYHNEMRIYGKVKNNSSVDTSFLVQKSGDIAGVYHGSEEDINISINSPFLMLSWAGDEPGEKEKFGNGGWLEPGEEQEFRVWASYLDTVNHFITYSYKLNMDIYFKNGDDQMFITFT